MRAQEIEQLQVAVRKIVRSKAKGRARNLQNDIVHGHVDLGGLGLDKLEDTINAARLKMVERFLHGHRMSYDIMTGTIYRLQHYARTDENPMSAEVCEYITPRNDMWLYNLKRWMEQHQIELKQGETPVVVGKYEYDQPIIDGITQKRHKREVVTSYK